MKTKLSIAVSLIFLFNGFSQAASFLDDDRSSIEKPDWISGLGKDLKVRVRGSVETADGQPTKEFELTARKASNDFGDELNVKLEGNRFEFWVPVGGQDHFIVKLDAHNKDHSAIDYQFISAYQLRSIAKHGMKIVLRPTERVLNVKVQHNKQPVAGAFVRIETSSSEKLVSQSDESGIAHFNVMHRTRLNQLTAWKTKSDGDSREYFLGGYSFHRDPPREPAASELVVNLMECETRTIRLVNEEDGSPVPNISLLVNPSTGSPDYQFVGRPDDQALTTNMNGEVQTPWFPTDMATAYVNINSTAWYVEGASESDWDGNTLTKKLKPAKWNRETVTGKIRIGSSDLSRDDLAGLFVECMSYQAEQENTVDMVYLFTDAEGNFQGNFLAGSTYSIVVNDSQLVSDCVGIIPFEKESEKTNHPELSVVKGHPIEIKVTSGTDNEPIPFLDMNFRAEKSISWMENGSSQHGSGGRRQWITTDEHGIAKTVGLAGEKVEVSVYTPNWRTTMPAVVSGDDVTRIPIHREISVSRKITGQVRLATGAKSDLANAHVEIGSIDGETKDRLSIKTDEQGKFEFETIAKTFGVFASTVDGKLAGVGRHSSTEPTDFILKLHPTKDFHGQLLGVENKPLANHGVYSLLRIEGKRGFNASFRTSFDVKKVEAKTDSEGNYTLQGVPVNLSFQISADPIEGDDDAAYLGRFYLTDDDERPRTVSKLWTDPNAQARRLLADRFNGGLRDCRLNGYRLIVICYEKDGTVETFVDNYFMDHDRTPEVYQYMQLVASSGGLDVEKLEDKALVEAIKKNRDFMQSKNWLKPAKGIVFACIFDDDGNEMGRVELDVADKTSGDAAVEFIKEFAPEVNDAKKKWQAAFQLAKDTDRQVLVRVSQRYCGPCFLLTRWLDEQKEILNKDYVMLKIDDFKDKNGAEIAEKLIQGRSVGVPFFGIFNTDGKLLIDSEGPVGNIGFPSEFEGQLHLRKMLESTRNRISDKEVGDLIKSLGE